MTRRSKGVAITPIKKSTASNENTGSSSDEGTPSPVPAKLASMPDSNSHKTSASKQPHPQTTPTAKQSLRRGQKSSKKSPNPIKKYVICAVDPTKIMNPPLQSCEQQPNENEGSQPPNLKRRRLSQRQGQAQPIYSRVWHPMDDIMNPKRAFKVKAKAYSPQNLPKEEEENDCSDEMEEFQIYESDSEAEGDEHRKEGDDTNDDVAQSFRDGPSPDRRRSSRTLLRGDVPNYDMRYHPAYDKACRPAAAKAATLRLSKIQRPRRESTDMSTLVDEQGVMPEQEVVAEEKPRMSAETTTPKLSNSLIHSVSIPELAQLPPPPVWSSLQNRYMKWGPLDYDKLEMLDRLTYRLQKGAPSQGNTLPMTWQEVKQVLFDYGEITLDELNSREGTEWLEARYKSVRLGIEAFFGSRPECSDKNDWTLLLTEGFDAFDKQRGSKYWKHHRHSVVSPTTTRATYRELGEVAETDDESESAGRGKQDKPAPKEDLGHNAPVVPESEDDEAEAMVAADELDFDRSTIIDFHGEGSTAEDPEITLVESMRGDNVLSSEGIMSDEQLGKLLSPMAQFLAAPTPLHPDSPPMQLIYADIKGIQPDDFVEGLCYEPPKSPYADHSASEPKFLDEFDLIGHKITIDVKHSVSNISATTTKTRKRKSRPSPKAEVSVHEDFPGRTPLIKRIIANNPPSPGTDVQKENLQDDSTVEHSSQISIHTPTNRPFRAATTSPIPLRYVAYSSLFGGPPGPQSPSI